jgi:hypothetical protein
MKSNKIEQVSLLDFYVQPRAEELCRQAAHGARLDSTKQY